MRFEFEALEDLDKGYSDRHFTLKKGESIELSDAGAEVVLSTAFGGGLKLVREIPETDDEKARVRVAEDKAALLKQPKEKLVKQAEKLGLPGAATLAKEPLANAIVDTKAAAKEAAPAKSTKGDK